MFNWNHIVYDVQNLQLTLVTGPLFRTKVLFSWLKTKLKVHISVWTTRGLSPYLSDSGETYSYHCFMQNLFDMPPSIWKKRSKNWVYGLTDGNKIKRIKMSISKLQTQLFECYFHVIVYYISSIRGNIKLIMFWCVLELQNVRHVLFFALWQMKIYLF